MVRADCSPLSSTKYRSKQGPYLLAFLRASSAAALSGARAPRSTWLRGGQRRGSPALGSAPSPSPHGSRQGRSAGAPRGLEIVKRRILFTPSFIRAYFTGLGAGEEPGRWRSEHPLRIHFRAAAPASGYLGGRSRGAADGALERGAAGAGKISPRRCQGFFFPL